MPGILSNFSVNVISKWFRDTSCRATAVTDVATTEGRSINLWITSSVMEYSGVVLSQLFWSFLRFDPSSLEGLEVEEEVEEEVVEEVKRLDELTDAEWDLFLVGCSSL